MIRPLTDNEMVALKHVVKCPWRYCYLGLGLAGLGRCAAAGDWEDPECPHYMSYDDYEAQQKARDDEDEVIFREAGG
jgi:hypothetical protein